MRTNEQTRLSESLANIAAALDIPDYVYEAATLKYEDIGFWLAAEDSNLRRYSPEVYPQGSSCLGTVVRPISDKDEYDIDLVCQLDLDKEQTTQKNLIQMVGDRLKLRDDLAKILKPRRRCWRLDYPPEDSMPQFHMDVLPCIPNRERPPTGILLSDRELTRWQKSNPKAYAIWFYDRMKVVLQQSKKALAESFEASVEDVPEWQVKTPLQIAIQILKRHRDIYFQNDLETKPVSMIVTTLAARAYNNQVDVYAALADIVRDMPNYVERRNGRWWVANPVDPDENFADKWNEYPQRRESFDRWLRKVQDDFASVGQQVTLNKAIEFLTPFLGQRVTASAATTKGVKLASVNLPEKPDVEVPGLDDTQHCQPPAWPVHERFKAKITGSVYPIKSNKNHWLLTNRSVPKQARLRFTVKTNTLFPYDVEWQVVNTGKEAAAAKQLRGDFYESDGPNVRWESTKYKGTHWVEAFIIKDGICVARSGRQMVKVR